MTTPDSDDDLYTVLVLTIVNRAVHDAQGNWHPLGAANPAQVQAEARRWLADERELVALLELGGFDAAPVVQRVQQILAMSHTRKETMHADNDHWLV
jgi:hypothetical protein